MFKPQGAALMGAQTRRHRTGLGHSIPPWVQLAMVAAPTWSDNMSAVLVTATKNDRCEESAERQLAGGASSRGRSTANGDAGRGKPGYRKCHGEVRNLRMAMYDW